MGRSLNKILSNVIIISFLILSLFSVYVYAEETSIQASVTVLSPLIITIVSPIMNAVYSSRSVTLNVGLSEKVYNISYNINNGAWIQLCSNCKSYYGKRAFSEDQNNLTIMAFSFTNQTHYSTRSFKTDTIYPYIYTVIPNASVITGNPMPFLVFYTESNLRNVTLQYGPKLERKAEFTNCPSGYKKYCSKSVNLSDFEGKTIYYRFILRDPFRYTVSAKLTSLVDGIKPKIHSTSPINTTRNGTFSVNYTELNLQKIFLDYGATLSFGNRVQLSGCTSGKYKSCSTSADLTGYNNSIIYYRFTVYDYSAGIFSNTEEVYVDL